MLVRPVDIVAKNQQGLVYFKVPGHYRFMSGVGAHYSVCKYVTSEEGT